MKFFFCLMSCFLIWPAASQTAASSRPVSSPASGFMGYWSAPDGSVLRIAPCGSAVCVSIAMISSTAPGTLDVHNPDPQLRSRSLCNVSIGTRFRTIDADHAEDGKLYDPLSGKTYSASLESAGSKLTLRGYVGIKAFGRSEVWMRAPSSVGSRPCGRAQ